MPRVRGAWIAVIVALTGLSGLAGCQDPLFPDDAPRSPYQRYQALRGESAPRYERGKQGAREPALRERLRPLGGQ